MTYRIGTEFLHDSWPYTYQIFSLSKLYKLLLDTQQAAQWDCSRELRFQLGLQLSAGNVVWRNTSFGSECLRCCWSSLCGHIKSSARPCVCVALSLYAYCVYALHKKWWLTSEHTHIFSSNILFLLEREPCGQQLLCTCKRSALEKSII